MHAVVGCGDAGTPDYMPIDAPPSVVNDGSSIDACTCQSPVNLKSKIRHLVFERTIQTSSGSALSCYDETPNNSIDGLIGGGYALGPSTLEPEFQLARFGIRINDIPSLGHSEKNAEVAWGAFLGTSVFSMEDLFVTAACVDTTAEPGVGRCERTFNVSHDVSYGALPTNGVTDASASCTNGMLVGGSCTAEGLSVRDVRVIQAGIDPTDPNRWLCSWRSLNEDVEIPVAAQTFCLEETIPAGCGCCPSFTEKVEVRQVTQELTSGTNRLQVSCEPDELLLLGNCVLNGRDSNELADTTMFLYGQPPGDDDTWGCSWNNPSGVEASAIATALCVAD